MSVISTYSIDTHINSFMYKLKNRVAKVNFLRNHSPSEMLPGVVATVTGEYYGYSEEKLMPSDIREVEVTVISVVVVAPGEFGIYGKVTTNKGVEEAYFNLDDVIRINTDGAAPGARAVIKPLTQVKRETAKKMRKFQPAFFTPGTRCIVDTGLASCGGPKEITVFKLKSDGPDHYCIDTGIPCESEFMKSAGLTDCYDIGYVTEILEHKPGKLVIEKRKGVPYASECRDHLTRKTGRSNTYVGNSSDMSIHILSNYDLQVGVVFNADKLFELLLKHGLITKVQLKGKWIDWDWTHTVIKKKKLKRFIRRNQGKFSANARAAQQVLDAREY